MDRIELKSPIAKKSEYSNLILETMIAGLPLLIFGIFLLILKGNLKELASFFREGDLLWVAASFLSLIIGKCVLSGEKPKGKIQIYVIFNFLFAFCLVAVYCGLKLIINLNLISDEMINVNTFFFFQIVVFGLSSIDYVLSKNLFSIV